MDQDDNSHDDNHVSWHVKKEAVELSPEGTIDQVKARFNEPSKVNQLKFVEE